MCVCVCVCVRAYVRVRACACASRGSCPHISPCTSQSSLLSLLVPPNPASHLSLYLPIQPPISPCTSQSSLPSLLVPPNPASHLSLYLPIQPPSVLRRLHPPRPLPLPLLSGTVPLSLCRCVGRCPVPCRSVASPSRSVSVRVPSESLCVSPCSVRVALCQSVFSPSRSLSFRSRPVPLPAAPPSSESQF